ncbi:hypothetical protein MSAN_02089500 [Mycena sanguinolenta]|uniref:Uncharacterized protein n=1 Tax=Mycena sanguinolenta TaxID=230812 RepID=A0A8H7CM61_9AGAR|nr:hypothetical protein MSAN_02089500 [Mycena sanguinolenta]
MLISQNSASAFSSIFLNASLGLCSHTRQTDPPQAPRLITIHAQTANSTMLRSTLPFGPSYRLPRPPFIALPLAAHRRSRKRFVLVSPTLRMSQPQQRQTRRLGLDRWRGCMCYRGDVCVLPLRIAHSVRDASRIPFIPHATRTNRRFAIALAAAAIAGEASPSWTHLALAGYQANAAAADSHTSPFASRLDLRRLCESLPCIVPFGGWRAYRYDQRLQLEILGPAYRGARGNAGAVRYAFRPSAGVSMRFGYHAAIFLNLRRFILDVCRGASLPRDGMEASSAGVFRTTRFPTLILVIASTPPVARHVLDNGSPIPRTIRPHSQSAGRRAHTLVAYLGAPSRHRPQPSAAVVVFHPASNPVPAEPTAVGGPETREESRVDYVGADAAFLPLPTCFTQSAPHFREPFHASSPLFGFSMTKLESTLVGDSPGTI